MNKDRIIELYIDFFRFDKRYEWDDEEILSSSNADDFTEFLVKIRDVLADEIDKNAAEIEIDRNTRYYNSTKKANVDRIYGTSTGMKVQEYIIEGE